MLTCIVEASLFACDAVAQEPVAPTIRAGALADDGFTLDRILMVETEEGKTLKVMLDAKTKITSGVNKADLSTLKVGIASSRRDAKTRTCSAQRR